MPYSVIILAAGLGKRMHSYKPKLLHPLAGKPLLEHVVSATHQLEPQHLFVIYGHGGDLLREQLGHLPVQWVEQKQRLGTGHAVSQAIPGIESDSQVLVLVGDIPLINPQTLKNLLAVCRDDRVGIVTAKVSDPTGLGRIVRDPHQHIVGIVEDKDTTSEQRQIKEINTGIICAPAHYLKAWLSQLGNDNAQGEYYLTDIIAMAVAAGVPVESVVAPSQYEIQGVNDRIQLNRLERHYQKNLAHELMREGVTLLDPERFDVRGELTVGKDTVIDVNVVFKGQVTIGECVEIGPNCVLQDVTIGDGVIVKSHSVIEEAVIGDRCVIGPFARIRPGTALGEAVRIGNFVEVKQANIGANSKVNHLSYIGDAQIGQRVNVGAGTITCNYDGANKHKTVIEDDVFIGSDTQLVAPVRVGQGATLGAGTTLTHDALPDSLTISRVRQRSITGWQKPEKLDD